MSVRYKEKETPKRNQLLPKPIVVSNEVATMATPLITALQTFAKDHHLNLGTSDISLQLGEIRANDYDSFYAAIARLLPLIPESLHLRLYEVASQAFTASEDFEHLRDACDRFLEQDSAPLLVDASGEIVKVEEPNTAKSRASPTSDASNHRPVPGETGEEYSNEYDALDDYGHECSADGPYPIDTIDATLGQIPGESSSRWKLPENGAFTRPKSCHRSLLYHAGYFPFERQFGVPYFATEAPADSHRYYDDAPTNADVQANKKSMAVDRATLVEAHRPWRRRWSQRESALLKELVASRAGGARGDSKFADADECRKIAKQWSLEVWDSLAVQAGKRLSGRPGHSLMCRYLNAENDELSESAAVFLRDSDAVNACLQDRDGGWDVVGAAVKHPGIACLRHWEETHAIQKSVWSYADDARLRKAVIAVGRRWSAVALIMGDRTGPQCMHRYVKQLTGKRVGRWSLEEIRKLREAVADVGNDWIEIARRVGSRNDVQCREKWVCGLDPGIKHGSWEKDEDELLRIAVEKAGTVIWANVAELVPGRTETQCRRRWVLLEKRPQPKAVPVTKRARQKAGRWSREELEHLREAVLEFGEAWGEIAKKVGTREEGQCREKWEVLSKTGLTDADAAAQAGSKAGRWSNEETRLLNEAVGQVGHEWLQVATRVGSRDEGQCREKWLALQHASQEPPWNRTDDEILRSSAESENVDWHLLSEKLKREESACRKRWDVLKQRQSKKRAAETGIDEGGVKRRKQGRWSLEETRLLKEGLRVHDRDFMAIAELVKTRNETQCRDKWKALMNAAAIDATWTDAEDDALTKAIEQHGLAWETIAESVPGRSVPQCRRRWKVLKANGRSASLGRWKADEIARLKMAVKEVGKDWAKVAERVGSRNDWQCRERYGSSWTEQDDIRLREVIGMVGLKWREVRKRMPGFSEVMCRRRWKELQGKANVDGGIEAEKVKGDLTAEDEVEENESMGA